MFKNLRLLSKDAAILVGGLNGFVLLCCAIAYATHSMDGIFGTYTQSGCIMAALTMLLLPISGMIKLQQLALSMGARRRGMWGATQITLILAAACAVATGIVSSRVAASIAPKGAMLFNLNRMDFVGVLVFAAVLWAIGNVSLLLSLLKHKLALVLGWIVFAIGLIALLILVVLTQINVWGSGGTIAICVTLSAGVAAAVGSYCKLLTISI